MAKKAELTINNSKRTLPKLISRTPRMIIDIKLNSKKVTPKMTANHSEIFAKRE